MRVQIPIILCLLLGILCSPSNQLLGDRADPTVFHPSLSTAASFPSDHVSVITTSRTYSILTKDQTLPKPIYHFHLQLIQLDKAPPKKLVSSGRNKIASENRDDTETPHYDSKCDACRNLKCLEILQRLDLKPPCPRSKKVSNQRVEKYMNHRQQKAGRKSRHRQTFRAINKKDLKRITRQCVLPRSLSKPSKDTVRSRAAASNYSIKTIYPDSKNPSVTSYHSFGSMSQEPMV